MKRRLIVPGLVLLPLLGSALGGCGHSSSSAAAASTSGSCASGYVLSTSYGCLAQSTCTAGYGLYNGSCVSLTGGASGSVTSSCVSVAQGIPFYATGAQVDAFGDLVAGPFPGSSSYGALTVGASTAASGQVFASGSSPGTSIQLTVQGYTAGSSSNAIILSGQLTLSSFEQLAIENDAIGTGLGASPYGNVPCVSEIALQGKLISSNTYTGTYTGNIYLYLNNSGHGVELAF